MTAILSNENNFCMVLNVLRLGRDVFKNEKMQSSFTNVFFEFLYLMILLTDKNF